MMTPIQWAFDLQDAMDVRDYINGVLRSGKEAHFSWHQLKTCRDRLHELVSEVGLADADEQYAEAYWHLWDALSYLTAAITGRDVNIQLLIDARDMLDALFALHGEGVPS